MVQTSRDRPKRGLSELRHESFQSCVIAFSSPHLFHNLGDALRITLHRTRPCRNPASRASSRPGKYIFCLILMLFLGSGMPMPCYETARICHCVSTLDCVPKAAANSTRIANSSTFRILTDRWNGVVPKNIKYLLISIVEMS